MVLFLLAKRYMLNQCSKDLNMENANSVSTPMEKCLLTEEVDD